jgi:arabinan endo-1,5-alpha-L-arabinosidase
MQGTMRRTLRIGIVLAGSLMAMTFAVGAAASGHLKDSHGARYRNPVLNHDFPDPDVIRAGNGWYYAYGTEGTAAGRHVNVQLARSRDLVHWTYVGDALPHLPRWGDAAQVSWAPDVVHRGGRYYLYYSIVPDRLLDEFGLCLAVATSQSPAGPFVTTRRPLYCGDTLADIDPAVVHDPRTGDWRMYWGSGGDIVTARLARSLVRLRAPLAQPRLLLRGWSSPVHRPYEHGIEGPFVLLHDGWYYLLYSGDNCCSYPPHYATMVARSRRAAGPYVRLAATRPGLSSVILRANRRWAGPGHVSVIRDRAGHDWLIHHAIDTRHPFLNNGGVRRPMLIERIVYRRGWPTVAHGSSAIGRRPAPITRRR